MYRRVLLENVQSKVSELLFFNQHDRNPVRCTHILCEGSLKSG